MQAWEIEAQLSTHPAGVTTATLIEPFSSRIGDEPGQISKKDWIAMVKSIAVLQNGKLTRRKP